MTPLDHDSNHQRLATLVRWLAPTILGFALVYAAMGGIFRDWRTVGSAGGIAMHGLLTILALFQLRRGHQFRAAYLVAGGSAVAIPILTVLQPALYPSLVVVPVLIAAVLLQYAPPQHARYYLTGCCAGVILVVFLGEAAPVTTRLPSYILDFLRLSSLLAITIFALVMLGQFSTRLQDTLAHLRAAYATLEAQHTELVRLSSQHELILNSAGEGIYGVDPQGSVTFVNPAAARMFGYDVADLIGQRLHAGSDDTDVDGTVDPVAADAISVMLRDGITRHRVDEVFLRKDGTSFPVEYVSAPIYEHGAVTGGVILFRDITERIQAHAALDAERARLARRVEERTADLSAANAELARAARLKDEFLANMSHELRTPLNAILGLSEALQEGVYGSLADRQLNTIRTVEYSGRHLLALINDILDLAKIEAGKMELQCEALEVDVVCQASLQFIKQLALKKGVAVSMIIDPTVTMIAADARRLKQILVNLLSNAVKFTAEGGAVGLDVAGDREHQVVRLTVWDTGIGIAPGDVGRLFKPFTQLDSRLTRQYEGTGLGLALVGRMVEMHGGSITVESTIGQGSRFTIALPWHESNAASTSPAPLTQPAKDRVPIPFIRRALIIEDSPAASRQLARYLSELGVEPTSQTSGIDAVTRALAMQPDIIILDLQLPDCSGWDVLTQLKTDPRTRSIPVLVVSVEDNQGRSAALGASAHLLKPIVSQQLHQALRKTVPPGIDAVVQALFCPTPASVAAEQPVVLLAEDNEANLTTLADYLQVKGYRVVGARNGVEALERAREVHPHIILMDIEMPKLDGVEATRRIRADGALGRIPIIALTALAMPGDRERCLAAGANDYISKPVSLKVLTASLEKLLTEPHALPLKVGKAP